MKNSIRITALIICAILLTASFTVIPSYAYYKEPGMEWVDDYSEFPDSERYLCDNIENYFVSAAYDLRHNGYTNFEEQGYKLNFMTTAEFYQTCVPKDENGNIVFPPLAASFPKFTNLLSSYVAGQTELSEKMRSLRPDIYISAAVANDTGAEFYCPNSSHGLASRNVDGV